MAEPVQQQYREYLTMAIISEEETDINAKIPITEGVPARIAVPQDLPIIWIKDE